LLSANKFHLWDEPERVLELDPRGALWLRGAGLERAGGLEGAAGPIDSP
jgi:hypothetical protein